MIIRPIERYSISWALLALVLILVGCGSSSPVGSIAISFPSSTVPVGGTMQLHAADTNFLHVTTDATATATWISSNPAVVSVNSSGLITGINPGYATIKASLGQDAGAAVITVTAATSNNPTSAGLLITPANATVYVGGGQQYTAIATSTGGTSTDVTASTKWSVTPASVATISSAGVLNTVAPGTFTVTGVSGGQTNTATGTVVAVTLSSIAITPGKPTIAGGATQQFKAIGTYNNGSSRDLTSTATWSTSDASQLQIDSTGLATASNDAATGMVTVTATSGAISATASAQLTSNISITNLVVEPTSSSIATGSAEQHKAIAWYSDGTQKDVTKLVTWTSTDSSTSPVNATGMNVAGTPGIATLTASLTSTPAHNVSAHTSGASPQAAATTVQSSSEVIVTPATITSLNIRASKDLFPVNTAQPIQLIGTFSDGTQQDLSLTANWQTSDPSIATIDSTGLATGVSAGPVVFSASFGGLTASTIGFQVLPSSLVGLVISIPRPVLIVGGSENFKAIGTYSDGTTHDLTPIATWQSSNPAAMPIDNTGFGYGLTGGSTQVTATVQGFSAISNVLTVALTVKSISVQPTNTSFALGTTQSMIAYGTYSNGAIRDITGFAIWRSEDPTILTIDANGRAKAGKVGTTRVTATRLGLTQESPDITVSTATLSSLIVLPTSALNGTGASGLITAPATTMQVAALTGVHYSALGIFSDGTLQDVSSDVIWNTSDNTVASIDTTGFAIGMKPGSVQVSASLAGQSASLPLNVTSAKLVDTGILPGNDKIPLGVTRQFSLIGEFDDGTKQDLTQDAVWIAPTPTISDVTLQGEVLGQGAGQGLVSAQYASFTDTTPVTVSTAKLVSTALTPTAVSVRQGSLLAYVNTGTYSDGQQVDLELGAVFSSDTPMVGQMLPSGVAYARSVGTAQIASTYQGTAQSTSLTVTSSNVTGIAITPASPTLVSGATQQFTAIATYADGTTSDVTASPFSTWTSSNPSVLSVSATGFSTASTTTTGTAVITLSYNPPTYGTTASLVTTATVTVTVGTIGNPTALQVTPTSAHIAAGTTKQLTATGAYADGTTRDLTALVTWTSTSPATATVSAKGLVTAIQGGTVSIQAQIQGASGTLMSSSIVIVSSATLQSLAISPSGASFAAGSTQPFTLTGTYSDGTTQNLTSSAVWTSSSAAIASISSTGLATGVAAGSVQFTASYGGLTVTSASNTVTASTLLTILLTPSTVSMAKGTTQQFTVVGLYSDGTTRDLTSSATYATSDPTVISINTSGVATVTGVGSAQITVMVSGKTASTQSVSVTPAVLSSIALTPHTLNLAKGTTQQFAATGSFTDGTTQDLNRQVVWTSGAPQVLTIDQNGLAASGSIGSTQITAALSGVSASTGNIVVTAATLVGMSLSPNSAQIAKGSSQQFTASGFFTDGTTQNLSSLVTWTSSNGNVASIDSNGLASGTGVGSAQLTATYQGKTAQTSSFQVTPATLTSLSFNPANPSVAAGTTTQVSVIGTYSDGSTQDLTSTAVFSSSSPAVATVNATGVVKGLQPGTSTITVMAGGQTSSFSVNVSAAVVVSLAITPTNPPAFAKGTTEQFSAIATFSDGTTQNVSSSVAWVSSNASVFTIDGNGLATGTGTGSASLTASFAGQTASTPTFQVTAAAVASIAVTQRNQSLSAGSTQQFTAIVTYTDSTIQDVTNSVVWSSSNPSALSVSASGLGTAGSVSNSASVVITASSGAVSGSVNVTVLAAANTPAPSLPVSLSVTPTSSQIAAGTMKQLTATGTYTDGTTRDLSATVLWTSTDSTKATVNSTGLVSSLVPGTVGIQAQIQGQYGVLTNSSIVVVTAAALQSLAISPSGASFASGSTQQFTLTGTYSDGTTQNLTSSATWSSSAPAVATVSATGLATGVSVGSVQLTAAYGGLTITSAVDMVTPATLVSISLTPSTPSFAKGTAQQFSVTGTYSDGSTRDLTSSAVYASTDPSVVSVSTTGLATGIGIGSAEVTVSVGGQTASTQSVTVTPAVLSTIAIAPQSLSFADGSTQQFTATGTFSDGTTQDLTQQAVWSSSNAQVLTIDQNGLATGGSIGSAQITAAFNGIGSHTGTINITPATLVRLRLSPTTAQVAKGTTQQFTATGVYTDGSTQNLTSTVAWTSSDGTVVSIDGGGLATGTGVGSAQLTASYLGKTVSTSSFAVTPATLVSVSFNPANPTVAAGTSTHVAVLGLYSDGTTQDLSSTATFSSSNPAVASVDANGLIHGNLPGTSTITVMAGGQTSSFNVAVSVAVLTSLAITPANPPDFAKGTTEQFTATGTFSDGSTQDLTSSVNWSSSNTSVFTINSNGLATGVGVGSGTLTAIYAGHTATTPVFQVTPAVVASIVVSPQNQSLVSGGMQQYTATATYTDSSTVDVSSTAVWSSSNTSVATVNSTGSASALAAGTTSIRAQVGSVTGTSMLSVTAVPVTLVSVAVTPQGKSVAVGSTQPYAAIATYSDGTMTDVSNTSVWSSSNTSVATVNMSGLASAATAGSAIITTQFGGMSGTSTLTVTAAPVTLVSVAVTPQAQSLVAGTTQQYRAVATYSDNSTADVSSASLWSSSNTSVATISRAGLVSAVAAGSSTITAQLNGQSATSTLTVTAAPVSPTLQQIIVTPASGSAGNLLSPHAKAQSRPTPHAVTPGATQQFIATGVYSDQSTQDLTTIVTWSSSLPSIATINSTGLASAQAAGTTSIQAQLNGISGSVNFTVTAPAVTLQSITITPSSGSIAKGNTQQFTASGLYSDGSTQTLTTQVTWQSSVPAVATIDSNGLATSVAGGNTQIWASLLGHTAVSTLTISPATLTSLAVTPQTASIASGTTQQYKAIGTLSDGSTQDLTSSVTWSTNNSSLVSISTSGLAVTSGTGTATIVATAGAVASTATLAVTTATATSIQVTPSPLSLPAGGSQQLLVTATFTDGSSQNVTSAATFTSSNASVVTVDSNGNLKAVGPGTATVAITLNGVTTTLSVTIGNATVTSIAITPQNPTLAAGQSQQLTATATYSDGSTEDLTSSVTWASSSSTVATVSPTGNVIVAQAGTATISASMGGVSASTTITGTAAVVTAISVSPASTTLAAGQTQQFAATATMSDGTQQTLTASVHWSVSDPSKANVSNSTGSNGLLTANAAGTLNVVASLNGINGAAAVTIQAATLTSLTINPGAILSLPAGTNQQLSVTGRYSDGSSADVTSLVVWSSSQASTAYVDAGAVLHAVRSGVTTINAAVQSITGTSVVTVGNATLRSIAITPAAPVLALGQTVQLTATGTYSDGSTANITSQVQWNSGTPAVATISSTGLVTTLAAGSSNLNATLNGVTQSAPLTVNNAVLQSISVQVANGGPASFALGTSLQLKAVGTYSDGSTQNLTSLVTWSSQTPAVGVVSSTGLATGVTPGTFSAKATKSGITGASSITVASASLISIAITPANAIIINLSTTRVQFTATGTFSDGSTQNLTNSVHWGTAGITVGGISSTGVFTPTAVGLGQITADLGAVSAAVGFTVITASL